MSITKMNSYDLKGNKLSFADWVSNISPTETPFVSMTGKEGISQTKFQWQTDVIPKVRDDNFCHEGSIPAFEDEVASTVVLTNNTQIFRRSVSVSDTANVVSYYGRQKEAGYQMEKASLELKRDMEAIFLSAQVKKDAGSAQAGLTDGFEAMVGTGKDTDTGATVVKTATSNTVFTEAELFEVTYNMYLANSKANVIMYHPKHAGFFSGLLSINDKAAPYVGVTRMKMFGAMDDEYNTEVDTIVDPLGQRYALVPNRFMPEKSVYFFNPSDWTQMVLRAPKKIQLAKVGSSEEWVIEAEIGLRHRNKFASGILKLAS